MMFFIFYNILLPFVFKCFILFVFIIDYN